MIFSPIELTISVIIPVYNGGISFHRCLSQLKKAMPQPIEVIVVSDGDTDGSWCVAEEFGVKVIRLSVQGGPARARNVGAQAAKGDILFFVDADVAIASDTLEKVASAFKREPDLAALIGSYDETPGSINFLSQYRNLLHHYVHQNGRREASTFWGACGAIRRDVFLAVGGFDERYRLPSIEDIELGYRLRRAGYRIRLCKAIQVKHLKHWGAVSMLKADLFYRAIPWTELLLRDRKLTNDLNLQTSNRISTVLVFALLGTLFAACWLPVLLVVAIAIAASLVLLNAPLYRFFQNQRGWKFALQTLPWHWLYYGCCGLGLLIGTVRYLLNKRNGFTPNLSTVQNWHSREKQLESANR